jgi:hypothetical protein
MTIILPLISGWFYCIGGRDKNSPEIDMWWFLGILPKWMFHGWVRDFGCTLCSTIAGSYFMTKYGHFEWWKIILFIILQFWACRSYFQWVNDLMLNMICDKCLKDGLLYCFDCEKGTYFENKQWWNWLLIGIVSSSKWLLVFKFSWILLAAIIAKSLLVMYVSIKEDNAVKEEFYRGIAII